jgi:phosphorylcholine metabolism protein LicD
MNKKHVILIIIISIIVLIQSTRYICSNIVIEYTKNIEFNRNKTMNGLCDMKKYINFAFHYKLFNLFELVTKKLDENNIKYFLICGGLIGYHRHNQSFIPWDDDIDIAIFEEDRDKLHELINKIIKENIKIKFNNIAGLDKLLYYEYEKDNNPSLIDIFYIKYYENDRMYSYNTFILKQIWPNEKISKDEIFPLKEVDYKLYLPDGKIMKTIKIKIPNKSINYLDRAYPKWKINYVPGVAHNVYYNFLFNFPFNYIFNKIIKNEKLIICN